MASKTKPTTKIAPAAPVAKSWRKSALVLKLLVRTEGATIAEIAAPTGWQRHSVRAYLSGLREKGRSIVREQRKSGETAYRIVDAASVAVAVMPVTDTMPVSHDSTDACGSVGDATGDGASVVRIAGAVAASSPASA